jgi:predicted MFS family arabinose efflux permease
MLARLYGRAAHLVGWGFAGVGLGIAVSGALVLAIGQVSTWRAAWWGAALLAGLLGAAAWALRPKPAGPRRPAEGYRELPPRNRWFAALLVSYTLEGVGYIIAGTFLVAAVSQNAPAWLGSGTWVLAGLAAAPSAAIWAYLARRYSLPNLILTALVIQAAGIALPGLYDGIAPAVISAVMFGSTFVAISSLALAIGIHLQVPRSVALLTTGYSAGQIIGPLAARPLLSEAPGGSYRDALLMAAAVVLAGAVAATALRFRFPERAGAMADPSASGRTACGRGLGSP